jgi:uncharacterized protein YkwD
MRRYVSVPSILLLVLLTAGLLVAAPPAVAAVTFEHRMLELVNRARVDAGIAPLQASAALAAVAADAPYDGCGFRTNGRSADMGARNYFSHTIQGCNQGVTHLLQGAGIAYSGAAENIVWASGLTDPAVAAERLHNDLMASSSHRTNLLDARWTHVGIGAWRTAAGQTWSGGGAALTKVYIATQIFTRLPVTPGSRYHPVAPSRILDTRLGPGPVGPGATLGLQVAGQGGIPSTGVSAVVLNVTVTSPTAPSYLTVFPAGEAMPTASNLNYVPGQTVPNLVTAKLGSGGRLSIFNAAGSVDVIADVAGWYDNGTLATGARFHAVAPGRILDTRLGGGPVGGGATAGLQVAGHAGVPASGVTAVVLNVTVTNPTAPSYLTVFPAGEARPNASNLNYVPGQTVPNLVTAKLGSGGRLSIFNAAGSVDVIADVAGWYDNGTLATGARFHPVTPSRILDTRLGGGPVGPAATAGLQVPGAGGVPSMGVSAVVVNVSVTNPTAPSYLTVFPAGQAMPTASNLNYVPGQTVPNLAAAKLGTGGQLSIFNAAGATDVIADVAGWFDAG